ncbi:MAG: hypothetical protein II942_04045 [Alphaproteobacteria bacterium]|nr:hypothetical protein [Alphaproteobacteria bacterium]
MELHRSLYILTAGEPDETAPVLNELKRPLSRKGVAQVLTLLERIKEKPFPLPDLILCSPSLYVRQTLDLLHEVLGNIDTTYKDALYSAPDYRILDIVRSLDDILSHVMILGELPGLNQFINYACEGLKNKKLKPAQGVLITLKDTQSWHTFGPQKTKCRSLFT